MPREPENNDGLDRLYAVIELLPEGKRQIAVIKQRDGREVAAITPDLLVARQLIVRFSAAIAGRRFILTEYVKVTDLMELKPR